MAIFRGTDADENISNGQVTPSVRSNPIDAVPNRASDQIYGGAGNDVFVLFDSGSSTPDLPPGILPGGDTVFGGPGNDRFYSQTGSGGGHLLVGGPGNDSFGWHGGTDTILGGPGNDAIGRHTASADVVRAGPGDDYIHIPVAHREIHAGSGDDVIKARIHATSHVTAGAGDDTILGSVVAGGYLNGGPGYDTFKTDKITSGGKYFGGTIKADMRPEKLLPDAAHLPYMEAVYTWFRGGAPDVVIGNSADNMISIATGDDYVEAGAGADTVMAGGNATILGGSGADLLRSGAISNGGTDILRGGWGSDTLEGDGTLSGGAGDDMITGGGRLFGGAGNDRLMAAEGNVGRARLDGGSGDNILMGASGRDTFVFREFATGTHRTVIHNFESGMDRLKDISGTLQASDSNADGLLSVADDGWGATSTALYYAGPTATLYVTGVTSLAIDDIY